MKKLKALVLVLILALGVTGMAACSQTFNVVFYAESTFGTSFIEMQTIQKGQKSMVIPAPIERSGYAFTQWQFEDGREFNITQVNSHVSVIARYAPLKYTLTFDPSNPDISHLAPIEVTFGEDIPEDKIPNVTKTGMKLMFFYEDIVYETDPADPNNPEKQITPFSFTSPYGIPKDTMLTAEWMSNNYLISFDKTDSSLKNHPSIYASYGTAIDEEPAVPEKKGYTFANWYRMDGNTKVTFDFDEVYDQDKDITLYAEWTLNSYIISFDDTDDSLTGYVNISIDFGKKPAESDVPADPVKTGSVFQNWFYYRGLVKVVFDFDEEYSLDSDIVLFAQWSNIHSVMFDSHDPVISGYTRLTVKGGESFDAGDKPADPTRPGHNFIKWYYLDGITKKAFSFDDQYDLGRDIVLYVDWQVKVFVVSFDRSDPALAGSAYYNRNFTYGETRQGPANPTKAGYTFAGWYYVDSEDNEVEFSFEDPYLIDQDIMLKAKWEAIP